MSVEWHKYGTQTTIYFPLIKASSQNFAVSGDYTHASGDVKISKDGGAAATATNSPAAITMGNGAIWSLTLTATEMQAAEVVVTIIDAATKAVEDQMIKLHTFGNASAKIVADLSAANLAANVTQFGGSNGSFASGRPEVNTTHIAGSSVSTSSAQIGVNVVNFGGSAGTFASGRPEVNASHWGGTAVASAVVQANAAQISGDSVAADNLEAMLDGTGGVTLTTAIAGNITGNLSGSVGSVSGNVSGSVGSISGVSFPSNFASLGINASGHVSRVTLCDTITTYTGNTPQTGDNYARLGAPAGASIAADIATRLATSGYTAPPSAASNASAVRTELATELARIDVATSTRLATSGYTAPLDAAGTRSAIGMAYADLDLQLDAILATTGSGAYTRTITVNDGTTALQGAKVRLTQGAESYVGTTNASGQVVFSVDAATWSIAIIKPGYAFTPTTLVVSASGSTTYSMTASGPTPSADPDKTTVRITCYGADTEPEASATVQLRQLTAPSGDEGHAFAGEWTTYTTDASGIVDVTLWSDCTYAIRRGTSGDPKQFTPTGATDSFASVLSR